jgi:RNA polymerase sigma-70 factor (ECF subfamily)
MTGTAGFDAFYAATSRRTLRQLAALCGDAAEAQDLVQEAYARAWQHWTRVAGYDDPEAWVRKVAFRLAANRWRSTRRWLAARTRHGAPPDASPPSLDHVANVAALRSLSPDQRRVVVLYYLCGLSVAEIAADSGTHEGTVRMRLSRARAALAPLLDDDARPWPTGEEVKHVRPT